MDSKISIRQYISRKPIMILISVVMFAVGIILNSNPFGPPLMGVGCMVFLFSALYFFPIKSKVKDSMLKLEAKGLVEKATEEMNSPDAKTVCKNKAILTENFLFCRKTGWAIELSEITWAYKHKFTQTVLFIPVYTTESLMVACGKNKVFQVLSFSGKDKKDELKDIILKAYSKNPNMLVGFTPENEKAHKVLRKQKA